MAYSKAFEDSVNDLYRMVSRFRSNKVQDVVSGVLLLILPETCDPLYGAMAGSYDENKNLRIDFTRRMFKLFCLTLAKMNVPMLELHADVDTAYLAAMKEDGDDN